jgi:hypothetical protein
MLFIVYCKDAPGDLRSKLRAQHLQHIMTHPQAYRFGAPLLGADGAAVGSLFIFEVEDRKQLDELMAVDPYFVGGLFRTIEIHPTRQIIPETAPGALALEIERELAKQRTG